MLLDWVFGRSHAGAPPLTSRPIRWHAKRRRPRWFEHLEQRIALTIDAGIAAGGNTTPPPDDPGFANVGIRGSGSAIYLGDGWVLTAAHVGAGTTIFNNTSYDLVANSAVQLANPAGAGYTPYTDLTLYQIDGLPNLPSLTIGGAAPAVGWNVIMIGNGRDENTSEAFWTSTWAPATTASPYAGYIWASTQMMRWGTNVISGVSIDEAVNADSQTSFDTQFTGNTQFDAQGSPGDSGGAVFYKDASGQWELVGVMSSISDLSGEPWGLSAFGQQTFSADLSVYRSEILSVMGANHAPTGASKTISMLEGASYAFATSDFGFSDPNDSPPNTLLAVKITTLPTAGTLADNGVAVTAGQFVAASDIAAGLLKFTPAANASGTSYASFTFQVEDNGGTAGGGANLDPSPKTMTVNVTATATVNHAPTGANNTISMLEGASYAFATSDFGFSDPNDSPPNTLLAVKITTLPTAGTLADNGVAVTAGQFVAASDIAAGLLKFAPAAGAYGTSYATFTFQVEDNGGTAGGGANLDPAPKTMTMNVTEVNHAPAGASKSISMLEGASYAFATSDFGFSDPNDSPANSLLAVKITTLPTKGALTDNGVAVTAGQFVAASDIAAGLLKFAPAAGAYGTSYATFTFQVEDNGGTAGGGANLDPAPKTMTMNVTEVSHAPTGTSKTINVLVSANYAFATSDFGFSDPNDTPANTMLAVKISTLPTKGTLTDNGAAVTAGQFVSAIDIAAGLLKFTPAVGTNGSPYTSFTFQVEDNGGTAGGGANLDPAPKTITINVTGTNNSSAPSVTTFSPAAGATSVATGASVTVTFSEALDATTVNASTVFLTSGNAAVAATLSYNAANDTVTVTPTMALANSTTYTITVVGGAAGVKDLSGNALTANATSSFTTVAAQATTFSLWPLSTMPTTAGSSDNKPIELGVQFTPSTSGFITGMRYYKSAANTGTHTGSLWSSTGQLLATATFTGEGASGWQQVMFSNPVAVTAGTTYVASYHTNTGHYAVNRSYFNSSYASGPLTVPAGGGVYTYGAGGFPTHSYQGSNYWVDVLFSTTPPIDNTPPAVTAFSPAGGATSAATGGSVTVTFSEALNAATVNASTVFLTSGSTAVAATLSYNAANDTVTLTPTSPLANSTTYTITVVGGTGGVTDLAGNALAANATSSFTTVAPLGPTASLWTLATTPAIVDSGDSQAIELGVKFTPTTSGFITGMRYYKSAANTGTHTGSLWSSTGQLLATATFTGEGASGWQQVMFSTPVAVTAGATYVAGYHTSTGHYAVNRSYFNSSYSSGSLVVPAGGGVYLYGAGGMPTKSYQGSNYWVDVLFSATTPPVGNNALPANTSNSTPPVVTAISPAAGATSVATGASVTVTFSEALDATTINSGTVFLTSGSAAVAATLSYNAANNTVTVTPTTTLANSTTYALTVVGGANGVKDLSGNALAANATSSFTTVAAQAATSSLWTLATTPAIVDSGDSQAVELGVKFTPTTSGFITGVRYYKSAANTGTHTGSLWSSTGQLLATATFTGEGASGWQQVMFSTPVAVTAGTTYVAGYHTNTGHYAVNRSYFLSSYVSGPLDVPASGGVYLYGAGGFPTQTYQASNYWIDVLFSAQAS